jgi:hypothetical protein
LFQLRLPGSWCCTCIALKRECTARRAYLKNPSIPCAQTETVLIISPVFPLSSEGKYHLGDLEVDRRITLELLLSKYRENMWTGYIYLSIGSSGKHVGMVMNCDSIKGRDVFFSAD